MNRPLLASFAIALLMVPSAAHADDLDIQLSRLRIAHVNDSSDAFGFDACSQAEAAGASTQSAAEGFTNRFDGYNACWSRLMSQLGASMVGGTIGPARTPGPAGFYMGLDLALTGIDSDAYYWRRGTEGDALSGALGEAENRFVPGAYQWMRLNMEKGLHYGFSLGGSAAYGIGSSYWALGASIQFAPFEGFRTGVGYAPDVAVRAGVMTLLSDSEFNLTVPTLDVIISKPYVIGGSFEITPIVAAQIQWTIADSELVDLTPSQDALQSCVPVAPYPCNADPSLGPACQSTDVCHAQTNTCRPASGPYRCTGDVSDLNNNEVFEQVRTVRARLAIGAQARYRQFVFRATFSYDVQAPETPRRAGSGEAGDPPTAEMNADGWESLARQWGLSFGLGFAY